MYIYRIYRKIKTGVPLFFWPPCIGWLETWQSIKWLSIVSIQYYSQFLEQRYDLIYKKS